MSAQHDPLTWYARNRAWLIATAGPRDQHRLAHEVAFWSGGVRTRAALHYSIEAHNAWESGAPLAVVRTRREAERYRAARDRGLLPVLPRKLQEFVRHLSRPEARASYPEWILATVASPVFGAPG